MRIIITKNGKIVVSEMEVENKTRDIHSVNSSPHTKIKPISYKLHKNKSMSSVNPILKNYFEKDGSKINMKELLQAKKIKVNQTKITMNKSFLEKYYSSIDDIHKQKLSKLTKILVPNNIKQEEKEMENGENKKQGLFLIPFNNNQIINSNKTVKKKLRMRDLISSDKYKKIYSYINKKNSRLSDNRIPVDINNINYRNDCKINSYNFRSHCDNLKKTHNSMVNLLNFSLNRNRNNLINYFKTKKSLSPIYYEKLAKYDDRQIYKINQICGNILEEEQEKKINEEMNIEKKEIKEKEIKDDINNNIDLVNQLMKKSHKVIFGYEGYKKNLLNKKKEDTKEVMDSIRMKYWNKFNVNKLNYKNRKEWLKYCNNYYSNDNSVNESSSYS